MDDLPSAPEGATLQDEREPEVGQEVESPSIDAHEKSRLAEIDKVFVDTEPRGEQLTAEARGEGVEQAQELFQPPETSPPKVETTVSSSPPKPETPVETPTVGNQARGLGSAAELITAERKADRAAANNK